MALVHEINFQKNFGNSESLDLFEFFFGRIFLDIFFGQIFFNEFFERIFGTLFLGLFFSSYKSKKKYLFFKMTI